MSPRPALSFVLPSIHDGLKLDCRIYHPSSQTPWKRHAAVVAHPYAPLGGSYDDPVVEVVASTLLRLGFVVATFNFRGASSAGGRTSWTSKPEQADYVSVAGFLAYYVHHLDSQPLSPSTAPQASESSLSEPPVFLSAGYSYGAMIVSRLPPLDAVLSQFEAPPISTPQADVRLRAQHLAEQWNAVATSPGSPQSSLGIRIGDGPRDLVDPEENIKKGVRELLKRSKLASGKTRSRQKGSGAETGQDSTMLNIRDAKTEEQCLEKDEGVIQFRSAYLVISLPLGLVTNLATMSFSTNRSSTDDKLALNPSLVVYGDLDGFMSLRKMREWTRSLVSSTDTATGKGGFRYIEISGAGHFWIEHGVMYRLRDAIATFAIELVGEGTLNSVYSII